ncbi:RagB/SusD family nutrient uptake outer membrane protein [Mucilaginibacter lutimaris]|uniref:RagB/SusD family nutrient uptake outer membrane protein n=1 Tax=Mucilaginibacter lutimaris TaxID=931629 RepID=A0ABW2ZBD2_9SPHI
MKKTIYTTLLILALVSCKKDTLNLVPQTQLSSGSFYKDAAQFNQALTGAYTYLRGIAFMGIYMDEMRSDNTFFTFYSADRGTGTSAEAYAEFIDNGTTSQEPNTPGNRYGNAYSGIAAVNTILTQLNNSSLSSAEKNQITGEALFLRAFYYYDLVTHYGGVPLQLEQVTDVDGAFMPRSTADEVYKQIIGDLTSAMPNLPVAKTFPQTGRATQGAAKMLLAYAYMSEPTREYQKAEAALIDITKMNYSLLPDYTSVFDLSNKNSQESIFEVQYKMGNDGQQSDFAWRFIPKSSSAKLLIGIDVSNGGGSLRSGGWNVPTQELVDSYENGDKRLPASIGVVEGTLASEILTPTAVKSPVGYTPTAGVNFYYFVKKYLHPPYQVDWNTDDNFPVYRYSGALLLLAECLVAEGKAGEALPYLNRVRARAGLQALTVANKESVANEMRHELAFENHRWTDLIRNGMAIDALKAKGQRLKAINGWLLPGTFNVTQERLIYAIPFRELQINNKLTQNPGY